MTGLRRTLTAAVVAAATITVLGACAPGSEPAPSGSSSPAPAPADTTAPAALPGGVTETQAADLCARMEGQLQSWRTYTPSMNKPGLNLLVGEWAAAHGVDLIALAGNRARVDEITAAQCPDIREQALEALEIPDFASSLVGY
ncbi:hypothetical protein [Rhodococcus zopfii]|uniref:hypothetical protein n=1 Tax=Rhodococcus zopfii TaxID=43772 RepID=UPI0035274BE6